MVSPVGSMCSLAFRSLQVRFLGSAHTFTSKAKNALNSWPQIYMSMQNSEGKPCFVSYNRGEKSLCTQQKK